MTKARSDCCAAALKVGGQGTTHWWVCTACNMSCNAVPGPAEPSSLLERVSCAIDRSICPDQWLHQDAARAAIREVAIWLMERGHRTQSLLVNKEADNF